MATWSRLAHSLLADPRVMNRTDPAFRAWVLSIVLSGQNLTDGRLDADAVAWIGRQLEGGRLASETLAELVESGLWTMLDGGGFEVVGFLEWNQSRQQVQESRKRDAARKRTV